MIFGRLTIARARHRSWRCPCERFSPPSVMGEERELNGFVFWLEFCVGVLEPEASLGGDANADGVTR